MKTTILTEVIAFLIGYKYYANIITTKGTNKIEISSFIFTSIEEANAHRERLNATLSFDVVETISFRSRKVLKT